jgi:hypothetical protein
MMASTTKARSSKLKKKRLQPSSSLATAAPAQAASAFASASSPALTTSLKSRSSEVVDDLDTRLSNGIPIPSYDDVIVVGVAAADTVTTGTASGVVDNGDTVNGTSVSFDVLKELNQNTLRRTTNKDSVWVTEGGEAHDTTSYGECGDDKTRVNGGRNKRKGEGGMNVFEVVDTDPVTTLRDHDVVAYGVVKGVVKGVSEGFASIVNPALSNTPSFSHLNKPHFPKSKVPSSPLPSPSPSPSSISTPVVPKTATLNVDVNVNTNTAFRHVVNTANNDSTNNSESDDDDMLLKPVKWRGRRVVDVVDGVVGGVVEDGDSVLLLNNVDNDVDGFYYSNNDYSNNNDGGDDDDDGAWSCSECTYRHAGVEGKCIECRICGKKRNRGDEVVRDGDWCCNDGVIGDKIRDEVYRDDGVRKIEEGGGRWKDCGGRNEGVEGKKGDKRKRIVNRGSSNLTQQSDDDFVPNKIKKNGTPPNKLLKKDVDKSCPKTTLSYKRMKYDVRQLDIQISHAVNKRNNIVKKIRKCRSMNDAVVNEYYGDFNGRNSDMSFYLDGFTGVIDNIKGAKKRTVTDYFVVTKDDKVGELIDMTGDVYPDIAHTLFDETKIKTEAKKQQEAGDEQPKQKALFENELRATVDDIVTEVVSRNTPPKPPEPSLLEQSRSIPSPISVTNHKLPDAGFCAYLVEENMRLRNLNRLLAKAVMEKEEGGVVEFMDLLEKGRGAALEEASADMKLSDAESDRNEDEDEEEDEEEEVMDESVN